MPESATSTSANSTTSPSRPSRRILITGVTRGLGRAMTNEFIKQGHVVVGCGRNAERLATLRARYGAPHRFDVVDVSDDRQVAAWASSVLQTHGAPDLLLNNAAVVNASAPLWTIPASAFNTVIDTNIKGVANVIRHLLPAMLAQGHGVVVNFSSGWGHSTAADVAPYCATKFAIEGLTQALAKELPKGMAAVPVNPGIIDTDMLRQSFGDRAADYQSPSDWAQRAVSFLLALGPKDNGQSLDVR